MDDPRSDDAAVNFFSFRRLLLAAFLLGLLAQSVLADTSLRVTPIVKAVREASPAVVNIQGQKSVVETESSRQVSKQVNGMGTGVLIDPRGFILTNFHVVDGVRRINVTLSTGQSFIAKIVARDPQTDLAIIRINPSFDMPVINLGTSQELMPGETVIAVGNAFGYENTVTTGIVSALHRNVQVNETQQYLDLIQTDASINPGNSGGPLLNIDGEMIGLNVAVRAGAQGIGFAIPVDNALEIATRMMSIEELESNWHGMDTLSMSKENGHVTVARVDSNSPAESCGITRGDQVERIGTVQIRRPLDIERALLGHRSGEQIPVVVRRDSQEITLDLTIASRTNRRPEIPAKMESFEAATWETLGLILEQESADSLRALELPYDGGMRVVSVRSGSSADQQGVKEGDILVRFHRWTTASKSDIQFLVDRADSLSRAGALKFYIVRGDKTHFAQMEVAARKNSVR
ncbi:trypsin-like peptidase domain-containing protein [Bythopirellula goksoeyrii]|uniref:Serine protease HtrA n=1 Tax=Bythopirellula goksoeyrii TaxID=1400387 RepID=A0A5B9QMM4_9BACT|nr:trypsin-like peptidase domain-containing protein [Bythopirellula goksoeyrii]QEG35371.1 Putative serine protease HtrA [Bythopirellula goksoeyrii]